ncbi:hypothetical protein WR25_07895 [Diploscapter pachys]|uniref:Uncharacterized protein n=1 Tax=Diploscapter pachys TaxID=2018661 RepID=A0A2A2LQI4_9BILA|nr:hypothetical protein WR25_07895 [Diploscapter pachys]
MIKPELRESHRQSSRQFGKGMDVQAGFRFKTNRNYDIREPSVGIPNASGRDVRPGPRWDDQRERVEGAVQHHSAGPCSHKQ